MRKKQKKEKAKRGEEWKQSSFEEMSFPRILAQINKTLSTGVLQITSPTGTSCIWFSQGQLVRIETARFASYLSRGGFISSAEARRITPDEEEADSDPIGAVRTLGAISRR